MEKVRRPGSTIDVKIGALVFSISPLSFDQKTEINALAASGDLVKGLEAAKKAVKYAVKGVKGLEDEEGPWSPEIDTEGLTDESLDILFNTTVQDSLAFVCLNLLQSIPDYFTNPHTGEKLEGVSIVKSGSRKKK